MKVSKLSISFDARLGSQVREAARKARAPSLNVACSSGRCKASGEKPSQLSVVVLDAGGSPSSTAPCYHQHDLLTEPLFIRIRRELGLLHLHDPPRREQAVDVHLEYGSLPSV